MESKPEVLPGTEAQGEMGNIKDQEQREGKKPQRDWKTVDREDRQPRRGCTEDRHGVQQGRRVSGTSAGSCTSEVRKGVVSPWNALASRPQASLAKPTF